MSDINMPLVSIIIPVYNGANYMREAIDSALAQTYKNCEIIVVNDGSRDDGETDRVARSYGDKIRYILKENGGVSTALNEGIRNMKGEYFSWLSHDDVYGPNKIAHQMSYACDDTVVMCGRYLINSKSERLEDVRDKYRFQEEKDLNHREALIALLQQGCFNGCALLIPKKAFDDSGLFDEELRYCQDFLMWIRIFLKGYKLKCIVNKDVQSRVHNAQLTNTRRDLFHSDCEKLGAAVMNDICRISNDQQNILYYFAKYNAIYDNPSVVKECIARGKNGKLFGLYEIWKLQMIGLYGRIRPIFRKIYYAIFKRVKVKLRGVLL